MTLFPGFSGGSYVAGNGAQITSWVDLTYRGLFSGTLEDPATSANANFNANTVLTLHIPVTPGVSVLDPGNFAVAEPSYSRTVIVYQSPGLSTDYTRFNPYTITGSISTSLGKDAQLDTFGPHDYFTYTVTSLSEHQLVMDWSFCSDTDNGNGTMVLAR